MLKGSRNVVAAVITIVTVATAAVIWYLTDIQDQRIVAVVVLGVGLLLAASPRIINEWERGVLLRLGRFQRVLEPGICWVLPFFDIIADLDQALQAAAVASSGAAS